MADSRVATLTHPLEGQRAVLADISLVPLPLARKLLLRLPEGSIAAAATKYGVTIPTEPCTSSRSGNRAALWLGPDEWMLIDADAGTPFPELGVSGSAVDISYRNCSIEVSGKLAEETLASGCPQDLSLQAFPVGKCSRTVFGKAEIILWRTDEETFHVDVWPSFASYVFNYLAEAAQAARN